MPTLPPGARGHSTDRSPTWWALVAHSLLLRCQRTLISIGELREELAEQRKGWDVYDNAMGRIEVYSSLCRLVHRGFYCMSHCCRGQKPISGRRWAGPCTLKVALLNPLSTIELTAFNIPPKDSNNSFL